MNKEYLIDLPAVLKGMKASNLIAPEVSLRFILFAIAERLERIAERLEYLEVLADLKRNS